MQTVEEYGSFPTAWTHTMFHDHPPAERGTGPPNLKDEPTEINWDAFWDSEDCFGPTLSTPFIPPSIPQQPATPMLNPAPSLPSSSASISPLLCSGFDDFVHGYTQPTGAQQTLRAEPEPEPDVPPSDAEQYSSASDTPSACSIKSEESDEDDSDADGEDEDEMEEDEEYEDDGDDDEDEEYNDPKGRSNRKCTKRPSKSNPWTSLSLKRPIRKHSRIRSQYSAQHNRRAKSVADLLAEIPGMEKIRWQSILQSTRGPEVGDREIQRRVKEAEILGARLFGGDIDKLLASLLNQHLEFLVEYVRTALATPKRRHRRAREMLFQCLTHMREKSLEKENKNYSSESESERLVGSPSVPSPVGERATSAM